MRILLTGGSKSGKSMVAQRLAKQLPGPWYYLATMEPTDEEDHARIRRHLEERAGWGFTTLEWGRALAENRKRTGVQGTFLLDSTTALLANLMFSRDGGFHPEACREAEEDLLRFSRQVKHCVVVSDWIYADAAVYDTMTECYRQGLAGLDRAMAREFDAVAEVTGGIPCWRKGGPLCME